MNIAVLLGIIILSLAVLTVVVYHLFLKHKIKKKKTVLFFLGSTYNIVFYTVLYCTFVNLILGIILEYATTTIKIWNGGELTYLFLAYCTPLVVPRMLMLCLQISVEQEDAGKKVSFCKGLKLFWTKPSKMKSLQKD